MKYTIETGIPIPENALPGSRPLSEESIAVRSLEVGQSVLLPMKEGRAAVNNEKVSSKRLGALKYFIVRTQPDKASVRVWRVPKPQGEKIL